jgi:hypothetical protein
VRQLAGRRAPLRELGDRSRVHTETLVGGHVPELAAADVEQVPKEKLDISYERLREQALKLGGEELTREQVAELIAEHTGYTPHEYRRRA